ncbi:MAG: hypothetical protein O2782_20880 [bacterium]|nr:hypothetical protein [bacterium]
MLAEADFAEFRALVEGQSLRHLRRYLDYGKRVRQASGLTELHQWLGRILLDREAVYGMEDKAFAFEIGACEWFAMHWEQLNYPEPGVVTVAGAVDKVLLVRLIVAARSTSERAALARLFSERYGRTWAWVRERATQLAGNEAPDSVQNSGPIEAGVIISGWQPATVLFMRFLEQLEKLDPLPGGTAAADAAQRELEAAEREE